jgi:rhodanese-related sulfurtransferase
MDATEVRKRATIHELLARARTRIDRVSVEEAHAEQAAGALLVDIRSEVQRARDGEVPGALWFPRNALEWRADPESGASDPRIARPDARLLLLCDEGYQSSLAAATLRELGFARVGDVIGGFQAWRAAGLPVRPCLGMGV